jgi:flagellin-specific chaperone FliS
MIGREDFRKKNIRGAKVIDLLEELEGLEEKARGGMETDNKDELYYWHGIAQFTMTFKNKIEKVFKIENM